MDAATLEAVALVGAVLGVASHLGYFIHGEHHMQGTRIYLSFFAVTTFLFVSVIRLDGNHSYLAASQTTAAASLSYLSTLTLSILTYRAFFHPLRNFPGPFSAKLSNFSHVFRIFKDSRNFVEVDKLHQEYGEFVRFGPNEITTTSPDAVAILLGSGSKCSKAPWYDCITTLIFPICFVDIAKANKCTTRYPNVSLQLTRSRVLHDKRRRIWDRAFTMKGKMLFKLIEKTTSSTDETLLALREYESRVRTYTNQLISVLDTKTGQSINASLWFNFYSFDIMGDMAFGQSFDMMKSGEKHSAIEILHGGMKPLGVFTPISWILPLLLDIPGLSGGIKAFQQYNKDRVAIRKENTPETPDLFSWLIDAEKQSNDPIHKDPRWLWGDSALIVVAGSDTTAATLTHIFYHLSRLPKVSSALRKELDAFYQPGSESEFKDLQEAPYLNGVINEALRLHPPVPSGLPRFTPPEGITIGSTYIPGNVQISTPFWSMGRLESCYKNAEEFLPERWEENSELILDKSVFVPFSSGPYGCVGKNLALMELRNVVARIVTEFDTKFAPGEDGRTLMEKSKDVFTMELAPLEVVFTKRKD
ncbi:Cytochrome P450 monooxygenase FCK2 [Lachnellula arida]|uniref:Cytochrome P450 monooxygenase FCK2 n=1 Tax=Lachnellula arida TaxID=1316785 RepID=A0A8T9BAF6_9HELO|nr:Cytochrome P450 monooxygenase FCK2 [Lachnellula arida]